MAHCLFQDRGTPARTTNTTVRITVLDNDDLDPKFTRDVYKAKIYEFYPMPVSVLFFFYTRPFRDYLSISH